ncbi:hypothetical protein HU200_011337 [Digitaria exilis]|uniref:Fungal lipase-type domain-containing protein n=1 Tax=Digitaria exilis TaxID=1010633 RepID=A0A835FGJ9_9POAL|nr:hypothetical protein HU200_011337 [Digitaria exilis]
MAALHPQCGGASSKARRVRCRAAKQNHRLRRGDRDIDGVLAGGGRRAGATTSSRTEEHGGDRGRHVAPGAGLRRLGGLIDPPPARSTLSSAPRSHANGDLVSACYKAFDLDPSSRRHLNCKYGRERMLDEVGMPGAGYVITRYIYAAADVTFPTMEPSTAGRGRWIGYVAVSTDDMTRRLGRRDVLVSFRGTVTPAEWVANLMSSLEPARFDPCDPRPDVKVESGFLSLYTSADKTCRFGGAGSCREQLLREVSRLVDACGKDRPGEDVSVTLAGHSMGSALALLFAYDLAELGLNRGAPVTVYSFGGPRVGNAAFKARCDELGVKALRVANVHDPITKLPGIFLNEATTGVLSPWRGSCYTHVGVELPLEFIKVGDLASVHDLGTYVALLRSGGERPLQGADSPRRRDGGVVAKVMEFVGRQRAGAVQWQDAALQMGGLVQTLG